MPQRTLITRISPLALLSGITLLLHLSVPTAWSCPPRFPTPTPTPKAECGRGDIQVTPNGLGDLLLFPYWTTQDRTTFLAIGNSTGGQAQTFVHVRLRECVNSQDVRDFTICLSPGDVWTAALTPDGENGSALTVGAPGSCDGAVQSAGFTPPPVPGQMVPLAAPCGYLEAFTMETCSATSPGGDDVLWGVGTLVNTGSKTAASYPATTVVEVNATTEGYQTAGDTALAAAIAREGGVDKEILQTRYMAGGPLHATTQVVLTFPAGRQPGPQEPISAYVFDEDENRNFSPRQLTLPQEVNVCTLAAEETGMTVLSCPGEGNSLMVLGPGGTFTSGWLRLLNNSVGAEADALDSLPATRFPVLGVVFLSTVVGETSSEQALPLQWQAIVGAGGFGGSAAFTLAPPQRFAPWRLPNKVRVTPGDATTGGLPLTGGH